MGRLVGTVITEDSASRLGRGTSHKPSPRKCAVSPLSCTITQKRHSSIYVLPLAKDLSSSLLGKQILALDAVNFIYIVLKSKE